jgi:HKD family nuclease
VVEARGLMPTESQFRWVFGLDDAFTQPSAINAALKTHNSELRTAPARASRAQPLFHPKVILLDRNENDESTLVIGSSNLTQTGLTSNFEAFSLIQTKSAGETRKAETFWSKFWNHATVFQPLQLPAYEERYKRNRTRTLPITDDPTTTIPREIINESVKTARLIWIEFGSMTGYHGEQVEIVKELVPFLGITGPYQTNDEFFVRIASPVGTRRYQLMFKKGMWRFMDIQQGFNETLKEEFESVSKFMLIIERTGKSGFKMRITEKSSSEAKKLKAESEALQFRFSTGYREYGWV